MIQKVNVWLKNKFQQNLKGKNCEVPLRLEFMFNFKFVVARSLLQYLNLSNYAVSKGHCFECCVLITILSFLI